METYSSNGIPISRKDFVSKLSPENRKIEIKKDNIQKTKNIVIGSLLAISVGSVIYGIYKGEKPITQTDIKKYENYIGYGVAGIFLSWMASVFLFSEK